MNAAKAAKKAAAEAKEQEEEAESPSEPEAEAPKAPTVEGSRELSPSELAELHEETGVKPNKAQISSEKAMRDYLMSFPKVQVVIPLQQGEKPGAVEIVQINGVTLNVKKGVMVALPRPFAEQVMNFTNIQMENGSVGGNFAITPGSDKAKQLS